MAHGMAYNDSSRSALLEVGRRRRLHQVKVIGRVWNLVRLGHLCLLLRDVARVALEEEREEHYEQGEELKDRDRVGVRDVGDQDGDHLPRVHRRGEHQGAELLHLRVDEELPAHGHRAQREGVAQEAGVRGAEAHDRAQLARAQQGQGGDYSRAAVHVQHLVVLRRLMLLEELFLEGRGEAIEGEEGQQQQQAVHAAALVRVLGLDVAGEEEDRDAACDATRDEPVPQAVRLLRDHDSPNHHRHHLEALAEHLHREGDELQGLVLAPRRRNVGERDGEILPERRLVCELLALCLDHAERVSYGDQPVAQHQEDGDAKELTAIVGL
mmetsp:Transcript_18975/g.48668  ORF Transcript_18975/g.48668 Transcript_18975/m.48668 type:complete len:325 (-) Transcript_18975:279-1253(-)